MDICCWEITRIDLGVGTNFHIEGVNHGAMDPRLVVFMWGVNDVSDPHFYAGPGLVISAEVQKRLDITGQIGSGK